MLHRFKCFTCGKAVAFEHPDKSLVILSLMGKHGWDKDVNDQWYCKVHRDNANKVSQRPITPTAK